MIHENTTVSPRLSLILRGNVTIPFTSRTRGSKGIGQRHIQIIEGLCYPWWMDDLIRSHRRWLKDSIRKTVDWNATGQSRGLPPPPAQKPVPPNARTTALPEPDRSIRSVPPAFFESLEAAEASGACFGQRFVGKGAVTFFWSVIPYRMEWRYAPAAHRVLPMDVGHVCQNLYLSAEAIGAGVCAVAAYDQEALDALLNLDGEEEFVIYLAPVGKHAISA